MTPFIKDKNQTTRCFFSKIIGLAIAIFLLQSTTFWDGELTAKPVNICSCCNNCTSVYDQCLAQCTQACGQSSDCMAPCTQQCGDIYFNECVLECLPAVDCGRYCPPDPPQKKHRSPAHPHKKRITS